MLVYRKGGDTEKRLFVVPELESEARELEKFCRTWTPLSAELKDPGEYQYSYLVIQKVKP